MTHLTWVLVCAGMGALAGLSLMGRSLAAPPEWSLRTNVSGVKVPAVLGAAVVFGGSAGALAVAIARIFDVAPDTRGTGSLRLACWIVFVLLAAAGLWDDRQGDEPARGFRGHLTARRLTGGVVKIAVGGAAGLIAAGLVYRDDLGMAALTALAVPLAANLFNLLDRAPGRTGKFALVIGVPLLAFGQEMWAVTAAGAFGALAAVLPADLGERGMLGDTGANALGGLVGLGLAVSLDRVPLAIAVAVLLALNAASERWSFSKVIDRTSLLRAFDALGRGRDRRGGR